MFLDLVKCSVYLLHSCLVSYSVHMPVYASHCKNCIASNELQ
jgi:hypothetical protein